MPIENTTMSQAKALLMFPSFVGKPAHVQDPVTWTVVDQS